jgi:adenylate kinase
MRLVLFGAPGSGKGTQARLIVEKYGIPKIVPSQLLREALQEATPLGMQARTALETNGSIPDEILIAIIRDRITQSDASRGFILDGFPETIAQAQAFDQLLEIMGKSLSAALLLETDFDALMQRITGRRSCLSCGHICNIYTDPPQLDGQCDECGGNLRHRADDNEEIISNRFRVYETQTTGIIDYYRENGSLRVAQGIGEVDDVFNALSAILDEIDIDEDESPMPTLEVLEQMIMEKAQRAQADDSSDVVAERQSKKKKSPAKKAVKVKTTPKTTSRKKAAAKKATPKKATTKKKTVSKKSSPKKATAKKKTTTSKKSQAKKVVAKKAATKKKATPKKASSKKKVVKKKAIVKKSTSKKKVATKKKVVKKKVTPRKKSGSPAKPKAKKVTTKKKQASKKTARPKTAVKKKKAAPKKTVKKSTRKKK